MDGDNKSEDNKEVEVDLTKTKETSSPSILNTFTANLNNNGSSPDYLRIAMTEYSGMPTTSQIINVIRRNVSASNTSSNAASNPTSPNTNASSVSSPNTPNNANISSGSPNNQNVSALEQFMRNNSPRNIMPNLRPTSTPNSSFPLSMTSQLSHLDQPMRNQNIVTPARANANRRNVYKSQNECRFRPEWLQDENMSRWLMEDPIRDSHIYCRPCNKFLKARKHDLFTHSNGHQHKAGLAKIHPDD